jgi:hypothetical protein
LRCADCADGSEKAFPWLTRRGCGGNRFSVSTEVSERVSEVIPHFNLRLERANVACYYELFLTEFGDLAQVPMSLVNLRGGNLESAPCS